MKTYISAGAGSGKTYTLTHRLADMIHHKQVDPEQVILTTFTKKAAAEFKEKAKAALYEQGEFDAASRLDHAVIGTIHSMAETLLKRYWYYLNLSPKLNIMTDEDADVYINQSLLGIPSAADLDLFRTFRNRFTPMKTENGFPVSNDTFWRDDLKAVVGMATNYQFHDEDYDLSRDYSISLLPTTDKTFQLEENDKFEKALNEMLSYDEQSLTKKLLNEAKEERNQIHNPSIPWAAKVRNTLQAAIEKEVELRVGSTFLPELQNIWINKENLELIRDYITTIFRLAREWRQKYADYKRQQHLVDFNDLEAYLLQLLKDDKAVGEIRQTYRLLMVDEFQDCSPIQIEIFDRLRDIVGDSICVGDFKQSIYGFRGSDSTLTQQVADETEARSITDKENYKFEILQDSHRSLKPLVEVVNECFEPVFLRLNGAIKEKVHLNPVKEDKTGCDNHLFYWKLEKHQSAAETLEPIAEGVYELIHKEQMSPNDIAILAKGNSSLDKLAGLLKAYNIPVNHAYGSIIDRPETQLLVSLLDIFQENRDALSKAQVALLSEKDYDTKKMIEDKLTSKAEKYKFYDDIPLVSRLNARRREWRHLSVAALVEAIIIELDLVSIVRHWPEGGSEREQNMYTLMSLAHDYEDHCHMMSIPVTIDGYKDYLRRPEAQSAGDVGGVTLTTYHASKGLEWKTCVLLDLEHDPEDEDDLLRYDYFGVHADHVDGGVRIRLLPWVFGASNTKVADEVKQHIRGNDFFERLRLNWLKEFGASNSNVSDEVKQHIRGNDFFERLKLNRLKEDARLLYVGMTRPSENMILALMDSTVICLIPKKRGESFRRVKEKTYEKSLTWLDKIYGEDKQDDSSLSSLHSSLKTRFLERCPSVEKPAPLLATEYTTMYKPKTVEAGNVRNQQPSLYVTDKPFVATNPVSVSTPIPIKGEVKPDTFGDCIHQIFCDMAHHPSLSTKHSSLFTLHSSLNQTLAGYGYSENVDAQSILSAWTAFRAYLQDHYGAATKDWHERPFIFCNDAGHVFTGSIDYVCQTADATLLIDFKTHGSNNSSKDIPDEALTQNAEGYSGQLACYEQPLAKAGCDNIRKFIFYPVLGKVVELNNHDD